MEALKLIGVAIVVVGFILKLDTIAVVVIAGIATGLVAGMDFMKILDVLGSSFVNQRLATLFVLTLPVIGIAERYGLKDKAVDFIKSTKRVTSGGVTSIYLVIRAIAGALSLRMGGHPQFIRPLIEPMASAASVAKYGSFSDKVADKIKGISAMSDNVGNFFAQNCFMGASGTLLIVSTLNAQGQDVTPLQIAAMSVPVAIIAVIGGCLFYWLFDKKLDKQLKGGAA
jgi:uncharacterized membrane protein